MVSERQFPVSGAGNTVRCNNSTQDEDSDFNLAGKSTRDGVGFFYHPKERAGIFQLFS